jgi:inactive STAND
MTAPPCFPSDDDLDAEFQIQQNLKGNQNQSYGQVKASDGGVINISNNYPFSPKGTPQFEPKFSGREIPPLLPYLPDRIEQEEELKKRIDNYPINDNSGPLICIIHGDELQSHHIFVERLKNRYIDLKLKPSVDCSLSWSPEDKKLKNLESHFHKELGRKLIDTPDADKEKIHKVICEYPGPVIARINLITDNWQNQGFGIVEKILHVWQNFPFFPPEKGLIVFVLIKYQSKDYEIAKKSIFSRIIHCFKNYFRKMYCRRTNKKIREQLKVLSKSEFKDFDRLSGMVLPELISINRTHVQNWVGETEVKNFLGEEVLGKLDEKIGKMFRNWEQENPSPHIPMSVLADRLTQIIKELQSFMGTL